MNNITRKLHDLGQSLWLDTISPELLATGTLARYIAELSVTGLTSNPTIFEQGIGNGDSYDKAIIERRIAVGRDPRVESVASLFVSRWDTAVKEILRTLVRIISSTPRVFLSGCSKARFAGNSGAIAKNSNAAAATQERPNVEIILTRVLSPSIRNRLGIAVAMRTYKAYCALLASTRWQTLATAGAHPQRLLWASTGSKDPAASDTLYVQALAAPNTINTMPEKTLLAFADHGLASATMASDGGDAEVIIEAFKRQGVDEQALAAQLQRDGTRAFSTSWQALLTRIEAKRKQQAGAPMVAPPPGSATHGRR